MPSGTFAANAVITDGLQKHYRDRDHIGFESDENIELDTQIGPWPAGTDLHTVLDELWTIANS